MDETLIQLESKIAFLENHCNELSDVIYQQQRQIDVLTRQQKQLDDKMQTLRDGGGIASGDEKPPHY